MKQSLLVLTAIILLTGCETTVKESVSPVVSPSKETTSMTQRHLPSHKDLAAEFSQAVIKTNKGDIVVDFYTDKSPVTVNNFMNLAQEEFYNGISFHRVIEDFMIQAGDPLSKESDRRYHGTGGPGYTFGDEFNDEPLVRGSLAMANSGPNTNGSQFFIVTAESTPWLDGKHTNFGIVIQGMNVVDDIENVQVDARDNPIDPIIIESVELK